MLCRFKADILKIPKGEDFVELGKRWLPLGMLVIYM